MNPVMCVVGARPNFIKMAPILRAMAAHQPPIPNVLVHTGQHYGSDMNERLFKALSLPQPDVNLEVGSGNHAQQTADVMRRFDPLLDTYQPSCIAVVGDVNSTLACSLVGCKRGVPVVHVESGLRSYDRTMPEEINRILTDQISDRLYTTERSAEVNLGREGVPQDRVVFAGNVMIDSVVFSLSLARSARETLEKFDANVALLQEPQGFGVVTLHRPSNVDDPAVLRAMLGVLREVAQRIPLVFTVHPRTHASIARFGLAELLEYTRLVLLPPLDYLEMLGLMAQARLVLTDSGGLQEETTALGVPCLTLRDNTERHITVQQGTNTLVGRDRRAILLAVEAVLQGRGKQGRIPECWDGHAAERIVSDLYCWLQSQ
ncbi:MAG: UDP-N-acetylglucosamine 2-epimerase (non-hydrolyzing) [Pseudomonadota bacterium]